MRRISSDACGPARKLSENDVVIRGDRILGARVDAGRSEEFLERITGLARAGVLSRVLFANVHMVVESSRNPALHQAMEDADLVCPDGMPIARLLERRHAGSQRMEGMSAFPSLLALAGESGIPVALFGSTRVALDATVGKIRREHPDLRLVLAHSPPFGPALEAGLAEDQIRLRQSGARMVFVALGCPRQELWMARLREVPACFLGIGNAFEIYAGLRYRAPVWARSLCLEWLFRLAQEPGRLGWRYASTNARFLRAVPGEIRRTRTP
jgi:N-acetylglucosaminyldiphosphoundecaprenol N-acetyl-beta-D-mannosaminyltransferase